MGIILLLSLISGFRMIVVNLGFAVLIIIGVVALAALWRKLTTRSSEAGQRTPISGLKYCGDDDVRPCVVSFGVDMDDNMIVNILVPSCFRRHRRRKHRRLHPPPQRPHPLQRHRGLHRPQRWTKRALPPRMPAPAYGALRANSGSTWVRSKAPARKTASSRRTCRLSSRA